MTGDYAERLAAEGFTTLAFDHRGFGESAGPAGGLRQHEDSQGKLADLRAAVGLLDGYQVAVVGICLGGGYAMRAAATDPRVRAVVGIAGAYNSPAWFAERMGLDAYRKALAGMIDRYAEPIPAVAPDGGEAAMPGDEPWEYYRAFVGTGWRNEVTRGSLHSLMTLDVLGCRPLLPPSMIVHGRRDDYCSPSWPRRCAPTRRSGWIASATSTSTTPSRTSRRRLPRPPPFCGSTASLQSFPGRRGGRKGIRSIARPASAPAVFEIRSLMSTVRRLPSVSPRTS